MLMAMAALRRMLRRKKGSLTGGDGRFGRMVVQSSASNQVDHSPVGWKTRKAPTSMKPPRVFTRRSVWWTAARLPEAFMLTRLIGLLLEDMDIFGFVIGRAAGHAPWQVETVPILTPKILLAGMRVEQHPLDPEFPAPR